MDWGKPLAARGCGFQRLPLTVFPGVVRCSQEDRCGCVKKTTKV